MKIQPPDLQDLIDYDPLSGAMVWKVFLSWKGSGGAGGRIR